MMTKEEKIINMFDFLQKHYSNVFGKIFVFESVFFDLLKLIECNFQDFTRYYEVFEVNEKLYFISQK
jgi:hypothetical protein